MQFGLDILDKSCQSIEKKAYFCAGFFFPTKKKKNNVKVGFFPTNAVDAVFLCFGIFENTKNWIYPPWEIFFTFNCFVFFCFHVLNLFVGWGVLIWKDVAFMGHDVVPFDNISPKQSRKINKKTKRYVLIYYLFLLAKKVFLECAKKKKHSKKTKKCW